MSQRAIEGPPPWRLTGFSWSAIGAAAAFSVIFILQAVSSFWHGDAAREVGWSAALRDDAWVVREVQPNGPAAGRLQPGDRILALDGDTRLGVIGSSWMLRHAPPGSAYTVSVERDGSTLEVALTQQVVHDPSYRPWIVIYLIDALAFALVGILIALAKPHEQVTRSGFFGSMLLALFLLWESSRPYDGTVQNFALTGQLLLGSVFPLYLVFGYRFFAGFPVLRKEEGAWRWFSSGLLIAAWLIWVPRTAVNVLQSFDPVTVVAFVYDNYWWLRIHFALSPFTETSFLIVAVIASITVTTRNYRRLPEGDQRCRIRWVAVGMMSSTVPIAIAAVADLGTTLAGASDATKQFVTTMKVGANTLLITMPIALGYAIIRHRVMGIHLVVRMGLRYMLAKAVLQGVMALPVVWLTWTVLTHPEATVGELLFRGSAGANLAVFGLGALLLRYRKPVRDAMDRRFFREAYDREQILIELADSIKKLNSIREIARLVNARIDAALHVDRTVILFRNDREKKFVVGYSSGSTGTRALISLDSGLLTRLEDDGRPNRWDRLRPSCRPEEQEWIDRIGIELIAPILGVDQTLVGLLMMGGKRSEEPYTPRDRMLLQTIGSQVGAVYEVLSLREAVGRERKAQHEVLGRLSEQEVNLLKQCPACDRCYDRDDTTCPDDGATLEMKLPVERTVDDRYRLERLLGMGGMGAVYEASDLRLNRTVAVKVMIGALFGDTSAKRRFAREAKVSAQLIDPHIIRVYDFGELRGDGAYLVMELVRGVTWGEEIARQGGVLPPPQAADLFGQFIDGMQTAHEAGVIHRDLKPDNVSVSRDGVTGVQVKILDFGLAKVREGSFLDPKSATTTGGVMGTLGYMAPEQFLGDKVDARADIYSMGVMGLESLTGTLELHGYVVHQLIMKQLHERLKGTDASVESLGLAGVLEKSLAWELSERYGTVLEMKDALLPAIHAYEKRTEDGA